MKVFPFRSRESRARPEAEEAAACQRELALAYSLFNEATDPLLVDQAIHRLLAAERGYDRLLARLRSSGEGS